MPKSKKLQQQIENKLETLQKLIEEIGNHSINSDDPEQRDSDYYYDLEAQLTKALELLRDKKGKELDDFGEPIVLEEGLCSLVDEYHSEEE